MSRLLLPRRLGLVLLLSGALPSRAGPPADPEDGAPPAMVAFFLSAGASCPEGWAPATEARGRLIAAVTTPLEVGVQVGRPLGDREDRAHEHPYSGQGTLLHKAIAAADGSNQSGARAGAVSFSGRTEAAPSGLPFIQLLVCERR